MKIEQVTTTYKTLTLTENELRETVADYKIKLLDMFKNMK